MRLGNAASWSSTQGLWVFPWVSSEVLGSLLKGGFKGDIGLYKDYMNLDWECFRLWAFLWALSMGP